MRDEHSDEDSEGEEANVGCSLSANVSITLIHSDPYGKMTEPAPKGPAA